MTTETKAEFLDVTLAAWTRRSTALLEVARTTPPATFRAMADALVAQWHRPDEGGNDYTYRLLAATYETTPPETLTAVIDRLDWIAGTQSEKNEAELPDTLAAPLDAFAALNGVGSEFTNRALSSALGGSAEPVNRNETGGSRD